MHPSLAAVAVLSMSFNVGIAAGPQGQVSHDTSPQVENSAALPTFPVPLPLPPPNLVRGSAHSSPWAIPNETKSQRERATSAFSRAFHLTEFDYVDPVGPWAVNSCGPFAVACVLEASQSPLSSEECESLQEQLDPHHTGTNPAEIADYLRQHWTVENVEPASTRQLVEHLHSGFPVMVTLNLSNSPHWVLVTGYIASDIGEIDSWLLVDNGTSGGRMSDAEFQDKWLGRLFKRHALFIGPPGPTAINAARRLDVAPSVSYDQTPYRLTMLDKLRMLSRQPETGAPVIIAIVLALLFGSVYGLLGVLWLADRAYQFVWLRWL